MSLLRDDDSATVRLGGLLIVLAALVFVVVYAPGAVQRPTRAPVLIHLVGGPFLPSNALARIQILIDPKADNRGVFAAIESDDFAASSYRDLAGRDAAYEQTFEFKDLPDGSYTAWAHLLRERDTTSVSEEFTVGAIQAEPFP